MDRTNYCAECEQRARENDRLTKELEVVWGLVTEVKKFREMLGPDGSYSICSATEGKPVIRLVDAVIVGSVMEKIDKHLAAIDEGKVE